MNYALSCLAVSLAATTTAQTFVVDASNGPGTNFTSIATAVAAVPDGAALQVRGGSYGSFTIDNKSLAVLGGPGVVIDDLPGTVEVRNLSSQRRVVIRNLEVRSPVVVGTIRCDTNLGAVLIEQCVSPLANGTGCQFRASQSAQVWLVDSEFNMGLNGAILTMDNSRVSMVRVTCPRAQGSSPWNFRISGGVTELIDCDIRTVPLPAAIGTPIQLVATSTMRLLGTTRIDNNVIPGLFGPAFSGAGTVLLDPTVQIVSAAPAFSPSTTVIPRAMPSLRARSAPLGSVQAAELRGPANGVGGLVAGLPAGPTQIAPFAELWFIDPANFVVMGGGSLGSPLTGSYAVPTNPALLATVIAWQGWCHDPTTGFQASNAVLVAHW